MGRAGWLVVLALGACGATTPPPVDPLDEKMRHCPLTVEGARAEIRDIEGGVELAVTAGAAGAVAQIRARVKHLDDFTHGRDTGVPHGGGKGGGFMRECPVVTKGTLVTGTELPDGVRIAVTAQDPAGVDALRAQTRRRYEALKTR